MTRHLLELLFVLMISMSLTAHAGLTAVCALGDGPMETMDMGGDGMPSCPACGESETLSVNPDPCTASGCVMLSVCPQQVQCGISPPALQPESIEHVLIGHLSAVDPPPPRTLLS